MTTTPKKSEQADTGEERKAPARRIRLLRRCLREGVILLLAVLSLTPLLGRGVHFLYDWLPLKPAHALYTLFNPDIVIDGELGYELALYDVLLFYGGILIIPWVLICRRYPRIPIILLAAFVLNALIV